MTRNESRLAALGLLVVSAVGTSMGVGCTTPGDDPGPAIPIEPAAIYAQMCARCHGVDGRGDPEMKKTVPVKDFSDPQFLAKTSYDEIARITMSGKNQMPPFGALLSAPKLQSVSGYVKRLGRGPAAKAAAPATVPSLDPPK